MKKLTLSILVVLSSCKDSTVTQEEFKHKIDSVLMLQRFQNIEIDKLKKNKGRIDTVIISNHKKTNANVKAIDKLNNSGIHNSFDSVLRAEGLGRLPNK